MSKAETLRAKRIALQQIKNMIIEKGGKPCNFYREDIEAAAKTAYQVNKEFYHDLARKELEL
jgi:hypothetical protein